MLWVQDGYVCDSFGFVWLFLIVVVFCVQDELLRGHTDSISAAPTRLRRDGRSIVAGVSEGIGSGTAVPGVGARLPLDATEQHDDSDLE